jgi:hypothetical protein
MARRSFWVTIQPAAPVAKRQGETAANCPRVLSIVGTTNSTISGVRLEDCVFHGMRLDDILTNGAMF